MIPGKRHQLGWSIPALAEHEDTLRRQGQALRGEAERIARGRDADTVSAEYVRLAAETLSLRRESPLFPLILAVGPALATLAGGILLTLWLVPPTSGPSTAALIIVFAVLIIGLLLTGMATWPVLSRIP